MRVSVPLIIFLCLAFVGCKESHHNLSVSSSPFDQRYFDSQELQQTRLEQFAERHSNPSEMDKINYLLNSVKRSKLVFIRNGVEHNSSNAVRWLKRKLYHKRMRANPITSAQDFIERIATKSNTTGLPYQVMWSDGYVMNSEDILKFELNSLEYYLTEKALQVASVEEPIAVNTTSENALGSVGSISATIPSVSVS